jgi:hypothetical protein
MRSAVVAFAVVLVLGLVATVAVGATQGSGLVYSLGATPANPLFELAPGDRSCQSPIIVPGGDRFDRVSFAVGTSGRPGPELEVLVLDDRTRERLAAGTLAGGYADRDEQPLQTVAVGDVETDAWLRICIVNRGHRRAIVYGQPGIASPNTSARVNGTAVDADMALFLEQDERSLIALLPTMLERAATFRAGWITPAVYAVLALLVLVAAPVALAFAVGRAEGGDRA